MAEENTTPEVQLNADDYLNNLKALKDNTVSKDEYNKLIEENKKLANALANGLPYDNDDDNEEEPVDLDAARKNFFGTHKTNLALFQDILTLRKAVMDAGGQDPFLPTHPEYVWNQADADLAQSIADVYQDCIDYAEGDPDVFNMALAKKCGQKMKK